MSDSYLQLLAHLSIPVDSEFNLPQELSNKLADKFGGEEAPIRCVLFVAPQAGSMWIKGESVAEYLVANRIELSESLSITFEYVRNQPSYLVEIAPKKKNTALDLKKFDKVFNEMKSSFPSASCLLVGDFRIVVKFADPEEAVRHCSSFVEPMKEDGSVAITCRIVLLKEHVAMRAFYSGGSQPFNRYAVKHGATHGQSMTDFLHSKFGHFKDRPVALDMSGLPSPASFMGSGGSGNVKYDAEGHASEEVNIVCATHFDYRLLRNSPALVLPNSAGSLVLRMNVDLKARKGGADKDEPAPAPVPPLRIVGPPALAPPPNLPHPSSLAHNAASGPSAPTPASAYIFW